MAHQFYFNTYILDNLPAPAKGFDVVQDMEESRLRLYITSRGVKTFFVRKRVNGKDKRIIIGNYPEVDVDDARAAVVSVLENASKKSIVRRKKVSFKEFLDLYLKNKVRRSEDSYMKLLRSVNRHLVDLFDKNIADISLDDLRDIISKISGAAIASRMQELLQSVFKYALEQGYVKQNSAVGLEKIKQNRRVRPLNKSGLRKLIKVIEKQEDVVLRGAFLMLVYGFAPRSKIFSMAWDDLDFNHDMWNGRPLSDRAILLLRDLPQDGDWVFPSHGGMHLMDPRTSWKRIVKQAGIPNLTMDDVYKFLIRQVVWASDKEEFRANLNALLDDILSDNLY
jgi:site-specific recombinase XerD